MTGRGAFLLYVVFIVAAPAFSQATFQKKLDVFLPTPLLRVATAGDAFYVADAFILNSVNRIHVYKLNAQGDVLWHREQINVDGNLQLWTMEAVADGIVLLFNSVTTNQSNTYLLKLAADGSVAWDRRYGIENFTQLFDIEADDEGNLWLSGLHLKTAMSDSSYHFLTKADNSGLPLANKQNYFRYFPNTGYEACRYTDLNWDTPNDRLVYVEDFENPYNQSAISSPNRGRSCFGYCSGTFEFDEKFTELKFDMLAHSNTALFFSGFTTLGNFMGSNTPVIGITDVTGKYARMVRRTPTLFKPLRSRSADIVYYIPQDKMLVKYDAGLEPIWSIKLDNCSETNSFEAEIAPDGSIYSVRNIDHKTVVARVLSDGSLSACITYPRTAPTLIDAFYQDWTTYGPKGYFDVPFQETLHAFALTDVPAMSTDFCIKMDASFTVPDLVCQGAEVIPENVDTTEGIRHTWDLDSFRSEDSIPVFSMNDLGRLTIYHSVENDFCRDTASRNIRVVAQPTIPFGDTLVCGPAFLTLDLNQASATRYYLDGTQVAPVVQIDQSGTYSIRVENDACFAEKDFQVRIVEFPPAILPLDSSWCHGDTVKVALRDDFDQVFWDNMPVPDSFVILNDAPHLYRARYEPDTACFVQGEYRVPRKNCGQGLDQVIYAPNVFAPDSGGPGAVFQVFPTKYALIRSLQIFDRWGSLVYEYKGETPEWDGTIRGGRAASDVYTYRIEYQDKRDESIQVQAGDVLLLR